MIYASDFIKCTFSQKNVSHLFEYFSFYKINMDFKGKDGDTLEKENLKIFFKLFKYWNQLYSYIKYKRIGPQIIEDNWFMQRSSEADFHEEYILFNILLFCLNSCLWQNSISKYISKCTEDLFLSNIKQLVWKGKYYWKRCLVTSIFH